MEILNRKENPFKGYEKKLLKEKKKLNPVHEIVNTYLEIRGFSDKPKDWFIKNKVFYPRLAAEAKLLLQACEGKLDDALWALSKMDYKATKGKFNWTIRTALKHDLK